MKQIILLISAFIIFSACSDNFAQIEIENAFPKLTFPQVVDIQTPADNTNRLFLISQPGKIYVIENKSDAEIKNEFLDITSKVLYGGEQGLLGLAFHPNYVTNGYFYINYTTSNPRRTIISRFRVDAGDINKADVNSEQILIEVEQPYSNHNGGCISFGPDGYLYISFGDGGSGGDPDNNGQNLKTILGSIVRIDVNNVSGIKNYSIPADNPFAENNEGFKEEIYAYGLRNVWKFSFDKSGYLWAADVGQNKWEEIDLIEKGKNYGWRIMEGSHCYNPSVNCDQSGTQLPIWEYGHNSEGGYSITGGYVYNGQKVQELIGKYVYADFVSGNIWTLTKNNNTMQNKLIKQTQYAISTFGVDNNGEIYFADYKSEGRIYKFKGSPATSSGSIIVPDFKLRQNFPNPFNPSTDIVYELPAKTNVKLDIYNTAGEFISTLVNDVKPAGIFSVKFDGSNYSSGVYIYKILTQNYWSVKKMLLLK